MLNDGLGLVPGRKEMMDNMENRVELLEKLSE